MTKHAHLIFCNGRCTVSVSSFFFIDQVSLYFNENVMMIFFFEVKLTSDTHVHVQNVQTQSPRHSENDNT